MSNIILTAIASDYAGKKTKEVCEKIKHPEVTVKGQINAIEEAIMFAVIFGYNLKNQQESDN